MSKKARVIAFYLPQYHPTPENDKFWGKGFTEWTNAAKAKPLFKGHHQPHIPADLGFYDLRIPEVREAQAELAKEAGIEGFCYWHYWFGNGKQFLQKIFDEVVDSGKPNFPFCVGWANHSWTNKNWVNTPTFSKDFYIAEQTYPGPKDHEAHFYSLLKAFKDPRYIKVDGKLLFYIFSPLDFPDVGEFMRLWNNLAAKEGLPGFYFIALKESGKPTKVSQMWKVFFNRKKKLFIDAKEEFSSVFKLGFDGVNSRGLCLAQYRYNHPFISLCRHIFNTILEKTIDWHPVDKYKYAKISVKLFTEEDKKDNIFPTIIPNWDRSPRAGIRANIWYGSKPEYFKKQIEMALDLVKDKPMDRRIIFLMAWNEWGEGNYMEPDLEFGHGYIKALREALTE
jgi:hypothetical protein